MPFAFPQTARCRAARPTVRPTAYWTLGLSVVAAGLGVAAARPAAAQTYSSTLTTLYPFTNTNGDGANPFDGVSFDSRGNIFGTTRNGGSGSDGTIFEIVNNGTPSSPVYNAPAVTVHQFVGSDGIHPEAGVTIDAGGNVFGTTTAATPQGYGSVYELVNIGTVSSPAYNPTVLTLYSFTGSGSDGANPYSRITIDASGNLLGTTMHGGPSSQGTVFEIANLGTASSPSYSSTSTTLYTFTNGTDGSYPPVGVTLDGKGNIIGTTLQSSSNDGSFLRSPTPVR